MELLNLKTLVCYRAPNSGFGCGVEAEHRFMTDSWLKDQVYLDCTLSQFIERASMLIDGTERVEGFLYVPETLEFVAQAIYHVGVDMHYGKIAMPISIITLPKYRGNKQIARALIGVKRQVIRRLGATKYLEVRNLSGTEQYSRVKYVELYNGKGI